MYSWLSVDSHSANIYNLLQPEEVTRGTWPEMSRDKNKNLRLMMPHYVDDLLESFHSIKSEKNKR